MDLRNRNHEGFRSAYEELKAGGKFGGKGGGYEGSMKKNRAAYTAYVAPRRPKAFHTYIPTNGWTHALIESLRCD